MMGLNIFLFPLQTTTASDFQYFSKGGGASSPVATIIFVAVFAAAIGVIVLINNRNNLTSKGTGTKAKSTGGGGGGGGPKLFSGFAFNRLARNIGLDSEQTKMLNFVFKSDDVVDPEKSVNTPALLDRHFRKAYRIIEQSSGSEQETQNRLFVLFSTRNILENSMIGGMSSTNQLRDDVTLTLTYGKEKINVNVVNARTELLTVEAPKTVLGSQIKIPKGTRLSALFFTKNNKGFSFETRVTGYATMHGHPVLQLAHSNHLRYLSQRRFKRRQAVIACFMHLVYVEGGGKKQRLVVDKRRLTGNIADISVGGCSIKTTTPVQVGARFKIEFTQGEYSVAALGQVLRTNRTGVNTIIHVKFLKVSQKSMNIINAFVYEYAHE
jgi:c-di-GMP-binding flagellar brake protein YcgR